MNGREGNLRKRTNNAVMNMRDRKGKDMMIRRTK